MAHVAECIAKLSAAGRITGKVADEALEFYKRSKAEYSNSYAAPVKAESPPAFVRAVPEIVRGRIVSSKQALHLLSIVSSFEQPRHEE
jgi:hypothetical protein